MPAQNGESEQTFGFAFLTDVARGIQSEIILLSQFFGLSDESVAQNMRDSRTNIARQIGSYR
jgi:hypothetical protein